MTAKDIRHFLVIFDSVADSVEVEKFGTDYDAAQDAYSKAEQAHQGDPRYDIVLLSADSLDTIKRTHSSYFGSSRRNELILG